MFEKTQEWMYGVIADPRDIHIAARGAEKYIMPSRTLNAAERVGVYHGMYLARLAEALEVDYPALAYYLGAHEFYELASRYLQKHPSRSYTLNRLGDHFPGTLRGFQRDLAKLELAMTQVFDEEENEPADLTQMPADRADVMRLVPINAFRMLALDYDANAAFSAFREGAHIHPQRKKTYLFIYRRDYSVYRVPLVKSAYDFLQQIVSGKTIGQAIEICRPKQQQLFEWFRDWSAAGIFRSFGE